MPDKSHPLEDLLRERIIVLDGAMGTMIQRCKLSEGDYRGKRFADWKGKDLKGSLELLQLTQPHIVEEIHVKGRELVGMPPLRHREMRPRRLQVLADREQLGADTPQIRDRGPHFVDVLTEAQHDPRLRQQSRVLGTRQHAEAVGFTPCSSCRPDLHPLAS